MLTPQLILPTHDKLVVDLFAEGGGASSGIEQAIGRPVDIAINHDPDAIGMHEANHPQASHFCADVWEVAPLKATGGRLVGLLHASPDCTDHSQAKGGQPRSKAIRSLAWVVHRWAGQVKPDVITLESVKQILRWSSLVAKRDPKTGRVVTLDLVTEHGRKSWRVAEPGERVPRDRQFLVPDRKRLGAQWRRFVAGLRAMGYAVQWRVICNADLGAYSSRTRLYMIARRDGLPITWPAKTHSKKPAGKLKRHRPASECIDWTIPSASIFGRKRPLADATLRRIAYGMRRFVTESPDPFIVNMAHGGRPELIDRPLSTIATERGGCRALVTAFMVQANGGFNTTPARDLRHPMSTVTSTGSQQQLVTVHLGKDDMDGALRCAAFMVNYYGTGTALNVRDPMPTVTTRDRMALVTAWIRGEPMVVADICMRMLAPRELYNAQDFPPDYIIDRTADGRMLTKKAQVRMVGNSVSPLPMRLIVAGNYRDYAAASGVESTSRRNAK